MTALSAETVFRGSPPSAGYEPNPTDIVNYLNALAILAGSDGTFTLDDVSALLSGKASSADLAGLDAKIDQSLKINNNLSDLLDLVKARQNLGLGSAATQNVADLPISDEAAEKNLQQDTLIAERNVTISKKNILADDRPGDAPHSFSATFAGSADEKESLADGNVNVVDGIGLAFMAHGAGNVARRDPVALASDVWEFSTRLARTKNPADPSNHTTEFGVAWLDKFKSQIDLQILQAEPTLTTSNGIVEMSYRVSAAAVSDVIVPPVGAIYAVPFVRTYGEDGITAIGTLRASNVTDIHGISSIDISQIVADAQAATDAANNAAALVASETLPTAGDVATYSRAAGVGVLTLKGGLSEFDGKGGQWAYDSDDTISSSDYPHVLVGSDGARYKPVRGTEVEVKGFAGLMAQTYSEVSDGDVVVDRNRGFRYLVKLAISTDYQIISTSGVLFKCLPSEDGSYSFTMMGPAADGVTDDFPKLRALLDIGDTRTISITFDEREYYMSRDIQLIRPAFLRGSGSGLDQNSGPKFVFPTDVAGIVINRQDTLDGGRVPSRGIGADGSLIVGLNLLSTTGADKTKHGIQMRARAFVDKVSAFGFSGNGIHIDATAGTSIDSRYGNANLWRVDTAYLNHNGGYGFYTAGADANSGAATGINAAYNGRGGIFDNSFLGNTYEGCHVAYNGLANRANNAADQSSYVSYGGNHYAASGAATEQELVDTTPGTDEDVWMLYGSGGTNVNIPLWTSGKPLGTYFAAFGYRTGNNNARNVLTGCYWESGSSGNWFDGPCIVVGGSIGWVMRGDHLRANSTGGYEVDRLRMGTDEGFTTTFTSDTILRVEHPNMSGVWQTLLSGSELQHRNNEQASDPAYYLTGDESVDNYSYRMAFNSFLLGDGSRRRMFTVGPTPTSGEYVRGDVIYTTAPTVGGVTGVTCTTGGTAGSTAVFTPRGS